MLKQIETLRIRLNNIMAKVFARLNVLEENAADATSSNITEGTLNQATSNRTVDMGGNTLDVVGTNNKTIKNTTGTVETKLSVTDANASISQRDTGVLRAITAATSGIFIDNNSDTYINLLNSGELNLFSGIGSYRIGVNSSSLPPVFPSSTSPYVLSLNPNNGVMYGLSSGSYFISDSNLSPAAAGSPTFTEVETYVNGLGSAVIASLKNRILYYTGTDTSTDPYTYSYYFSGDAKLFELSASSDEKLVRYLTMNVPYTTVDSNVVGKVIASLAIPQDLYINGDYKIKQIEYHCKTTTSGVNNISSILKDYGGTLANFTINGFTSGGIINLNSVFLDSNHGDYLFVEVSSATGAIEDLAITLTIG